MGSLHNLCFAPQEIGSRCIHGTSEKTETLFRSCFRCGHWHTAADLTHLLGQRMSVYRIQRHHDSDPEYVHRRGLYPDQHFGNYVLVHRTDRHIWDHPLVSSQLKGGSSWVLHNAQVYLVGRAYVVVRAVAAAFGRNHGFRQQQNGGRH